MRKGRVSEELVAELLRSLGFNVKKNFEIIKEGRVVAEVDVVAEPPKERLCVEVKSGKIDVSAVRQAYANAKLVGCKPVVAGVGWANEEAEIVAKELGVEAIMISDLYLCPKEEIYLITKSALLAVIEELLEILLKPGKRDILDVIAESESFEEAAEKLGVSEKEMARIISRGRKEGWLPKGSWEVLRAFARIKREFEDAKGKD